MNINNNKISNYSDYFSIFDKNKSMMITIGTKYLQRKVFKFNYKISSF